MGHYRLFIIAVCARADGGAAVDPLAARASAAGCAPSVDDPRVAGGPGHQRQRACSCSTFAVGSGLAGLGGALGAEVLGLDPTFPLKFMIYFLIVVAVGGTSSITGPLLAALLLGIADVAGKYYIPKLGAFIVYTLMIVILMWRPQGLFVRAGGQVMELPVQHRCAARALAALGARAVARWPSLLPLAAAARRMRCCVNEIAIVALFAISLDLVLGYAGIVSLGHAAFFGFGAYTAALFAKHVMPDPLVGLAGGDRAARPLLGARGQRHRSCAAPT